MLVNNLPELPVESHRAGGTALYLHLSSLGAALLTLVEQFLLQWAFTQAPASPGSGPDTTKQGCQLNTQRGIYLNSYVFSAKKS